MAFTPHTETDIQNMLASIGAKQIGALFDEIPKTLLIDELDNIPSRVTEHELLREIQDKLRSKQHARCFIGAGAYEHHIPALVWDIASRGEFMTTYTPYQAEASQGSLQLIYEFQTMFARLTGMQVANASLYDGGSALAEAILMGKRIQRKKADKAVLLAGSLNPFYTQTVATLVKQQAIALQTLPLDANNGQLDLTALTQLNADDYACLVIQQPNFFGQLEDVDSLTDWAHQHGILVIAQVNPMSLALLKEPGAWGQQGADIVCGEGQPFGVPLAAGGPYYGFLCSKQQYVRQMPGRIVGRTVDQDGKPGFTLTLQAREQHIRRAKATSNICTNQGLLVTAATIYLSVLGSEGLYNVATHCHANTQALRTKLCSLSGVNAKYSDAFFNECVLELPMPCRDILPALAAQGIQGGYDLGQHDPALANCLLICATETKTAQDIDDYYTALGAVLEAAA